MNAEIVVVETRAGSRDKFETDPQTNELRLDRRLPAGIVFPIDYGYFPGTRGDDGDPLDAVVLGASPLEPGSPFRVRILGVLWMQDSGARDDKVVCVVAGDDAMGEVTSIDDVPTELREGIIHFFDTYKAREPGADTILSGWGDEQAARDVLQRARAQRPTGRPST